MRRNLSPVTCYLQPFTHAPLSSDEPLPISDEPTRDVSAHGGEDFDSLSFSGQDAKLGPDAGVPERLGDYVVRELIGSGGMGNVYSAEHVRMGRVVAIKMLPIARMKDESAIERFYDEVRAASRLLHPNIVAAFDAGETEGGIHYLAMEYVDGVTLTRWIAMRGPLPVGEAAAIIRQAALGLLHAHRAGIVHRDVKPGNLMRASDGTIKVLDLGLARIATANVRRAPAAGEKLDPLEIIKSSKGRLVGTLPFMSPEQLEDPDSADERSDIYSLGATMYFLLTASPPFVGEYLDQVYGHRHGEIPDLMQARGDVDMNFANIFNRMMAKKPQQRYASLDEVIDDLSDYASQTDAPIWLSEFANRMPRTDSSMMGNSTFGGGSTAGAVAQVLAIDFGMFYSAAAIASPSGGVGPLPAGGADYPLFRMAIASDDEKLVFGQNAIERRVEYPQNLVHCLPIYIGKSVVERKIAGRSCPPEVLMAMMIRQIRKNAWIDDESPQATAITVPACYDQLHRRSLLRAASIAGLRSVRLVDRSIAAVQSLLIDPSADNGLMRVVPDNGKIVLFVGVSGQATEVAVIRRDSARLHQLATAGHWHLGTLAWLHKLVDLAAGAFEVTHGIDPRRNIKTAATLQIACERAMNAMLLSAKVQVKILHQQKELSVSIDRDTWIDACDGLAGEITAAIRRALDEAAVKIDDVDVCVTMGPVMRMAALRDRVLVGLRPEVDRCVVDRTDVAQGAAACLAAELPGRGDIAMPPRVVTSQSIGIVIEDAKGRRRILPIIPRGTLLPARTNRRLTIGSQRTSMTLSLVESSGYAGEDWQSLGRHQIDVSESSPGVSRMIGFEVNVNGLLSVRAQSAGTPASMRLPTLPPETLTDEEAAQWTRWLDGLR